MTTNDRQLLLAKYLFRNGTRALAERGPYSKGMAVSLFQDATETMAWAVVKKTDAQVGARPSFESLWDSVRAGRQNPKATELPAKAKMAEVNKGRVNFKHYGIGPTAADAVRFREYTEEFLTTCCERFWDLKFNTITLIDLVEDAEIKSLLSEADAALNSEDAGTALAKCAEARLEILRPFRTLVPAADLQSFPGAMSELEARSLLELAHYLAKIINQNREFTIMSSLRISLVDLMRCSAVLPGVSKSPFGGPVQVYRWQQRGSVEDARFAIDLVTEMAISVEEILHGMSSEERQTLR